MVQRLKNIYHLFQAILANLWYGFPSRKIKVIGITGTDGKTTTTHLIYHVLKKAGFRVSMISTVLARVAGQEYETGLHTTTPSSFLIQKMLKKAVSNKDEYFVLETTSHALDQNRVWGISFYIGLITNITHEHLDYHNSYEEYVTTKAKLLSMSKIRIANKDDRSYRYLKSQISNLKFTTQNLKTIDKITKLTKFNKYNYSAAYTVCKTIEISDEKIKSALKTFILPKGRLETVYDKKFKVIIDFAHTPNAFENLLSEIKNMYLKNSGKLIHVFGSAGLRDKSKRSLMGKASSNYSDYIILTEEDYRTEKPSDIFKDIISGMGDYSNYETLADRQKAINKAIALAKGGDTVLITGKAHEKSLCRGKTEYPWSEHDAVIKALKILNTKFKDPNNF
ncbi:MAG: UDP-N-acetylmuramoyl-L-alanyl-D-glutamate-2,6-diaminopimelate ligase [Candidatus Roizmanbacteria bacterium GW2011_GWA2_35_8]|uniref:UDP-N-acetylmuramoyl-L-alanyl-D-glutamate-2, 6-diaminopimelate ligase n=1 Tax=Candidatus Roizmanbacteria bacterium GW2011_GWA2_35_8 TaxID=1618479 RepID=A0A0G0D1T0_9BACT|nr:MAG: UDP-N-acetylmuramoyl-L-alanyl-D-glutamate-2,6-diaminopimelate ligase [Candidatus Roizmanbacteria bacterium GW2011_GWA2_35_8]